MIDGIKPLLLCEEKRIVDNGKEIISANIYSDFVLYLQDQCFFNSLFILFCFICFVVVKDMLHLGRALDHISITVLLIQNCTSEMILDSYK